MPRLAHLLALALLLAPAPARPTADGPDFYRVADTPGGGHLPLRAGPGTAHAEIARLPAGTDGLINLGCVGGLDLAAWQTADPAARAAARAARWCRVGAGARIGWARGMHLREGADTGRWRGGPRRHDLASTGWRVRDLAAVPLAAPAQASIRFGTDGSVSGHSGCNRFAGGFEGGSGALRLGPLATTRMACPPERMELERRVLAALQAVRSMAATDGLLALFDADGALLATLARRDPD